MNREAVLFNLQEAKEELDRTIKEFESDPDYDFGTFFVSMSHLYHHLNTAWNARDASEHDTANVCKATSKRGASFQKTKSFFSYDRKS